MKLHADSRMLRFLISVYRRIPGRPLSRQLRKLLFAYLATLPNPMIAKRRGIVWELDLGDLIDRSIYLRSCFEPSTTSALTALSRPGMNALDIGANIGAHTLPLAKHIFPGTVYAFEPMPWARNKLQRNIALNGIANIRVEPLGLSDRPGRHDIHFRSSWRLGDNGRWTSENSESLRPVPIEFATLDSYVRERALPQIDLMKLDVDGYEMKVLRGAIETLRDHRPILLMEFGHFVRNVGDDPKELAELLRDAGYQFFHEDDFSAFRDAEALLRSVPPDGAINIVCSTSALSGVAGM
jgi:FkbM family methyltransferase